jgi:hypothetical protein
MIFSLKETPQFIFGKSLLARALAWIIQIKAKFAKKKFMQQ